MLDVRESLIQYIYDAHKDAYGFKGRHYDFDSMSMKELEAEADKVSEAVEYEIEREKAAAMAAIKAFEEDVNFYISLGAGDRSVALRWMTHDLNTNFNQDIESWVYEQGFLFTDQGHDLVKELQGIFQ